MDDKQDLRIIKESFKSEYEFDTGETLYIWKMQLHDGRKYGHAAYDEDLVKQIAKNTKTKLRDER